MKCPKCVEQGKKSVLRDFGCETTLMYSHPFYDEEGEYHVHDPNWKNQIYKCSNGHTLHHKHKALCPNPKCNWGKEYWGEPVCY